MIQQRGFDGLQIVLSQPANSKTSSVTSILTREPSPPTGQQSGLAVFFENLTFDIRDAIFHDGTIIFDVKLKFPVTVIKITLCNPSVKKHFDAVKNYLWKLVGKRKILAT